VLSIHARVPSCLVGRKRGQSENPKRLRLPRRSSFKPTDSGPEQDSSESDWTAMALLNMAAAARSQCRRRTGCCIGVLLLSWF